MSTAVTETIAGVRDLVAAARTAGRTIGLVPTMGALHAGHGRLIERAREDGGLVVVSIFVNPIQFNQASDYQAYPRVLDEDVRFCDRLGVDVVFAPGDREMYPHPQQALVEVTGVSDHMEGAFRPGHFRGVATVVLKLFEIVGPDRAYFGEKDAQQLAVVRRMVRDLNVPVTIVPVPTVRENDGLALSSRNRRLRPADRPRALALYRALQKAAALIQAGGRDAAVVKREAVATVPSEPALRLEYLEIADPDEMRPVARIDGPVRIAGALWVGDVRLIDNILVEPGRH